MLRQTIIALILIAAAAISAYFWYSSRDKSLASGSDIEAQNAGTSEFRKLLGSLKTLKLDTEFFNDPAYKSLIDPNVIISKPAEYGRINPFVPIGAVVITPKR